MIHRSNRYGARVMPASRYPMNQGRSKPWDPALWALKQRLGPTYVASSPSRDGVTMAEADRINAEARA